MSKFSLALQPEALVNTSGRVLFSSPGCGEKKHSPCKPGVPGSIPGFSNQLDKNLSCGPDPGKEQSYYEPHCEHF